VFTCWLRLTACTTCGAGTKRIARKPRAQHPSRATPGRAWSSRLRLVADDGTARLADAGDMTRTWRHCRLRLGCLVFPRDSFCYGLQAQRRRRCLRVPLRAECLLAGLATRQADCVAEWLCWPFVGLPWVGQRRHCATTADHASPPDHDSRLTRLVRCTDGTQVVLVRLYS
jgi:hypothetical protein